MPLLWTLPFRTGDGAELELLKSHSRSYGNVFTILPFTNVLVTLKVTGDQLRRVMEDALNNILDPKLGGTVGSYPFAAGLRWSVDFTKPYHYRYANIDVNKRLSDKWFRLT